MEGEKMKNHFLSHHANQDVGHELRKDLIKMRKKKASISIILLTIVIGLFAAGCSDMDTTLIPNEKNGVQEKNAIHAIVCKHKEIGGDLVGLNTQGEVAATLVSDINIGSGNYDVYKESLYYIKDGFLYRINISNKDYTPEKMFKVSGEWELQAGKDNVYIYGYVEGDNANPMQLCGYSLKDGSKKMITDDSSNQWYFNKTKNQIFFTKSADGHLYMYDLNTDKESKFADSSSIVYGDDTKLFLSHLKKQADGSYKPEEEEFFIYDFAQNKQTKFDGNLMGAFDYKSSIIYKEGQNDTYPGGTRIMKSSYDGQKELIYDFRKIIDSSKAGKNMKILNVVLFGSKIPVVFGRGDETDIEKGAQGYECYFVDLNTKEVAKVGHEYYLEDKVEKSGADISYFINQSKCITLSQ